jgi:spermidine synthase
MPGQPLTAIHLGAGALTLPRYVEHTRPGSRQQVIELEQPLVDLVRAELPLPRGAQVRVRIGDARDVAARLPAGLQGSADLVVSDVFAGAQTPAHLTTVEYFRILAGVCTSASTITSAITARTVATSRRANARPAPSATLTSRTPSAESSPSAISSSPPRTHRCP